MFEARYSERNWGLHFNILLYSVLQMLEIVGAHFHRNKIMETHVDTRRFFIVLTFFILSIFIIIKRSAT